MKKILILLLLPAILPLLCTNALQAQEPDSTNNQRIQWPPHREEGAVTIADTLLYVVTDSAAFLNSSYGEDRLGGVKMNYIDKDIVLKAVGATKELYKIALGESRCAFIPKEMVHPVEQDSANAEIAEDYAALLSGVPAITSSFSARNIGKRDRVSLRLSSRCPFTICQERDPHRITVQLYGLVANTAWLTHFSGLEAVESVDVQQSGWDVVTITVNLKKRSSWGYEAYYSGKNFTLEIKHTPNLSLKGLVIGLDAGHGGKSSGAVSRDGIKEKEMNMDMVYILQEMLQKRGARVVLSRDGDIDLSMQQRKEIFRNNDIDLLVSVHCNAASAGVRGTSTYYKYLPYRDLAEKIITRLLEIEGVKEFGLVGNFNFSLEGTTAYPTVLVETLFMSDPEDMAMLKNPRIRRQMMSKVVKGLEDYLKYCRKIDKQ